MSAAGSDPPPPPPGLVAADRDVLDSRDRLGVVVHDAVVAALPELASEPALAGLLRSAVADLLTAGLSAIGSGVPVDAARAPGAALDLARRLAQRQVPLSTMLRAYRVGQSAFQQDLIMQVAQRSDSADEVAVAARELLSAAFSFVDLVTEEVVAAYQAEHEGWLRRRNAARLARVNAVLCADGGPDQLVDYPLDVVHVGAVVWCGPDGDETLLERQVADAADAIGCRRAPLVVAPDASTLWVWFPAPTRSATAIASALGPDTYAAVGDPGRGADGFRRTHEQAGNGHRIATAAAPEARRTVTTPRLLGPLALLALGPGALGPWARAVLGGLAVDDEPTAALRDTLWAYLSAGRSRAAAASALHVHRNTIEYRLRKAEQAMGRPLDEDRLALEVALLACRVLGAGALGLAAGPGRSHR